jgi:hypothetical protein
MSEDLSLVAGTGLTAYRYILNKQKADDDWIEEQRKLLEKAKAPRGQTELMILPAIIMMLDHCAKSN